jgi:hypothetical protein
MLKFFNLRVLSMLGGLALVGVAAYLNVHHAAESEGGNYLAPVCIAIVALAFASALAVPVMLTFSRNGYRKSALAALIGLVCGESYGFQLSAERLLAARAQRVQQVQTAGSPYALAREALDLATKDRKAECTATRGSVKYCDQLRAREEQARTALSKLPVPKSHALIADATGLPAWAVEIVPAMAFSTGLLLLGLVLVGFGGHSMKAEAPAVPEPMPDGTEHVVSWVREYRRRHGRDPKITQVQGAFRGLSKTTAWRRIRSS